MLPEEQDKLQNKKLLYAMLIVVSAILFPVILNYGGVTEIQGIHNLFLTISLVFILSLAYIIYFKQNYRTLAFWVWVVICILFIVSSLLYIYLIVFSDKL